MIDCKICHIESPAVYEWCQRLRRKPGIRNAPCGGTKIGERRRNKCPNKFDSVQENPPEPERTEESHSL